MIQKEPIYITGHQHPDTDSIAAAIAYAFFKRANGIKAIPCRLGDLNTETKYLLNRFGGKTVGGNSFLLVWDSIM